MPSTLSTLSDLSLISIFKYLPPEDLLQVGQITSRWNCLQRATINALNKKSLTLLIGDQAESLFTGSNFPKAESGVSVEILRRKILTQSTVTRLTTEHQGIRSLHIAYYSTLAGLDRLQVLLQFWQSTLTTLTLRFHVRYNAEPIRMRTQRLHALFTTINALTSLRRLTLECTFALVHPGPALQAVLDRLEEFYFSAPHLSLTSEEIRRLEVTSRGHLPPVLRANSQMKRLEIPNTVQLYDLPVLYGLPCRKAMRRLHLRDRSNKIERPRSEYQLRNLCTNLISLEVLEFEVDPSISMAKLAGCLFNLSALVELHLGLNFCVISAYQLLAFSPSDRHLPSLSSIRHLYLNLKLLHHNQLPWHPFATIFPNLEQLQLAGLSIYYPGFCYTSRSIILEPHCTQCYSEGIVSNGEHCLRMVALIWQQRCPRLKRIYWPFGKTEN